VKRFHVHVAVDDLPASVEFYSQLFGRVVSKQRPDYANWLLDDPAVNFAISARGHSAGVNHFGFQAESPEELAALKKLADAASGGKVLEQGETSCCYARSEKHWTIDPQGLAWENFLTMEDALVFGQDIAMQVGACCIPERDVPAGTTAGSPCCIPNDHSSDAVECCSSVEVNAHAKQ
jgi:predicted enzyme related to lactoylglutathione lyase